MRRFALALLTLAGVAGFAEAAQAQFVFQWRQVGGGWQSDLHQSRTPTCGHGANAVCHGEDYRGQYRNGETALFWIRGCDRRPIEIQCNVSRLR